MLVAGSSAACSDTEFSKLEVLGRAETINMLDERLRYLATPAEVLSFFLNPEAVSRTSPELVEGFWILPAGQTSQAQWKFEQATSFFTPDQILSCELATSSTPRILWISVLL